MAKMTYVEALAIAIEAVEDEAVKEKLKALKAQTEKRNSAEKKPTKTQVANEGLKDAILEVLADGKARTISELTADVAGLEGASPQKVNALLMQLQKAKAVVREEVKRKAYFALA